VPNNLKYYRQKKGYHQKDIAKAIGKSPSMISLIERNKRRFSVEDAELLADVLGTTAANLLCLNSGRNVKK
jgi:transcriptional regulator with XRE-family HTH domain